jgi:predicted metalloprotease with PDZ domain
MHVHKLRILSVAFLSAALASAMAQPAPIRLDVDATGAPRRIFRAHLSIPVSPGPLTLLYPEWIPGEHAPTGPITNLTGLVFTAGGKRIPWRRDDVDMYAFHCDVPPGATTLDVSLDFLSAADTQGFSSGGSTSDKLAVISWNQLLLYPKGNIRELTYKASLRLPDGWKFGTALPVASENRDRIEFQPVTLNMLVDSPVSAGQYYRVIPLAAQPVRHEIDLAGDTEAALEVPEGMLNGFKRLVPEAQALFGAHHYNDYHFLLTLSDHVAHFGLEHHQSSDDRIGASSFSDEKMRLHSAGLLPHEFVHSWNGKYRRPAGLTTQDYSQPMKGDMLWVYEGLTTYLGNVLTTRSGLWTPEQYRDSLAQVAAYLEHEPGREWRSLEDTAVAAQLLYAAPPTWDTWRRGTDFYDEGALLWLEADTIIRQKTGNQRSLDDFCKEFYGPPSGPPELKPFTFDELTAALNRIVPYDWATFFRTRLNYVGPRVPEGGIEASGWRVVYNDKPNDFGHGADAAYSIGLRVDKDGDVINAISGMPAANAGITPGMKVVGVNSHAWSDKALEEALKKNGNGTQTIDLLVSNDNYFHNYKVSYTGAGRRYPHLERIPGAPDLLGDILKPKTR